MPKRSKRLTRAWPALAAATAFLGLSIAALAMEGSGTGAAVGPAGSDPSAQQPPPAPSPREEYSPVVRDTSQTNLYWGDTHLHTSNSADAFANGNESLAPHEAFRLARGEEIHATNGMRVRLRRPLDFLAVTDHAEYLGVFPHLKRNDPAMAEWPLGRELASYMARGDRSALSMGFSKALHSTDPALRAPLAVQQTIWADVARTAERFNAPGRFTALIGYEWTSMVGGDNLHRVVLFKDGADKAGRALPFSAQDSTDPEALWAALDRYERETGGEALAIAHNGNVSNGRMFAPTRLDGSPLTAAYARARSRWEPVYEVTQLKGDGETHPTLSPTDEFADFERWDQGNLIMSAAKQPWMLRYEYARSALGEGLRHEAKLGVNPFKFGMVGSTDSHVGYSAVAEHDFWGKFPSSEPSPDRATTNMSNRVTSDAHRNWRLGASGLAAVWAPENTREAIFAAFKRREVYGTTGSRIMLRFFGGFEYRASDVQRPDYVRIGYAKGVPMGGDLIAAGGKAPTFMIAAARDPDEANLDRIQIVKGWLDAKGRSHEKVYDVALSDGRRVDPKTGKAPPVGTTVDVADASYTNSIGDAELATVWRDPDFDPARPAFYYVRVLEIPKPRWVAYDAKFFKTKLPGSIPMTIQDRAYSSPIWYKP